jgi:photosystem II stability/assembly factor-like uncharacterized protein
VWRAPLLLAFVALLVQGAQATTEAKLRWSVHGPDGGTVSELEIDPQRPSIMYAGTSGGIFRSLDAGRSWQRRSDGLRPNFSVSNLELAPASSTLYFQEGGLLYRSADGGGTWRTLPVLDPGPDDLAVADARTLYAATRNGLLRSTDGGMSWLRIGLVGLDLVEIAPSAPSILYGGSSDGLMRSIDGGASWTRRYAANVDFLTVDPRDANVVYFGNSYDGLWKSTNGGPDARLIRPGRTPFSEITALAVDPRNSQRIYYGTEFAGVFGSPDGGVSWRRVSGGFPRSELIRDLEISRSRGSPVFAATYHRGLLQTVDGKRWKPTNRGLVATQINSLVTDPAVSATAYAGTFKGGVAKTVDGGRHWSARGLGGQIVFGLAVDPVRPDNVWAATSDGVYRSPEGGRTWRRMLAVPMHSGSSVAVAPSAGRVIYAGIGGRSLYHSTNGGKTWRKPELRPKQTVYSIVVHPRRPLTVWAGTVGTVLKSTDGGVTWLKPGAGLFEYMVVSALVMHPSNPRILYAGGELGGVYRSVDGGAHWHSMNNGIRSSIYGLAIDRRRPRILYAGGYDHNSVGHVFRSTNGAHSWEEISEGMTTTWSASLALNRPGTRLYVGTGSFGGESGGGVFTARVR